MDTTILLTNQCYPSTYPYLKRVGQLLFFTLALLITAACGTYKQIGLQGRLTTPSGAPLNGAYDFTFAYWTCASGTGDGCNKVYEETKTDITVTNGLFNAAVGPDSFLPNANLDPAIFAQPLWLEMSVNGEALTPRQPLLGSPYAMTLVGGAVVASFHQGPGGTDGTDANYASLTVSALAAKGTALGIVAASSGGDLVRACTGVTIGSTTRVCENLRFLVTNDGNVTADGAFTGGGADFAELIQVNDQAIHYEPGDVLVISTQRDRAVEHAATAYASGLIGVYSTDPALVGGGKLVENGAAGYIPVAITGIVPVKVTAENGAIRRGDWLTSAGMPGYAMRADAYQPGAMLGKAMGELETGTGLIEVVLFLQ